MVLRLGMISLVMGFMLAGCGVKGPLEAPSVAAKAAAGAQAPAGTAPAADDKPIAPDKPFVLDGLI